MPLFEYRMHDHINDDLRVSNRILSSVVKKREIIVEKLEFLNSKICNCQNIFRFEYKNDRSFLKNRTWQRWSKLVWYVKWWMFLIWLRSMNHRLWLIDTSKFRSKKQFMLFANNINESICFWWFMKLSSRQNLCFIAKNDCFDDCIVVWYLLKFFRICWLNHWWRFDFDAASTNDETKRWFWICDMLAFWREIKIQLIYSEVDDS